MAVEPKYTEQMPFVGTGTQKRLVERVATEGAVSKARVTRAALDMLLGTDDGELSVDGANMDGKTEDEIVAEVIERITGRSVEVSGGGALV